MLLWFRRAISLAFLIVLPCTLARAQDVSTFQIWLEETAGFNVANGVFGNVFVTQYFVDGRTTYRSMSVAPSIQWSFLAPFLAEAAVFVEYADQQSISDVVELRPYIALRYADVYGRFEPYAFLRQEFRNLYFVDTDTFDDRLRLRLRVGSRVAISDERIGPDTWYGIADVEFFRNLDGAPSEYFNSRVRYHAGVGYRIGDLWSAEVHYMFQRSRSYANQPFDSYDNILRLSVRKAF